MIITCDPHDTLALASVGPYYGADSFPSEEAEDAAIDAQAALDAAYWPVWERVVRQLAAERGYHDVEIYAGGDARELDRMTRTPLHPDDPDDGETVEADIAQAAHDRIAVVRTAEGTWEVRG